MRAWLVLGLLLVPLLPLAPAQEADPPDLRIVELLPDPADGGREFIELWNAGATAVDLAGWNVTDAADTTFTFSTTSLPADARIVVWSGGEPDEAGPAWGNTFVWNNGGDRALLHAPDGTLVDTFAYGDHPDAGPDAPDKGTALVLQGGTWAEGEPTPGHAGTGGDAGVTAEVPEVGPAVTGLDAPARVRTGENVTVRFNASDPNGDLAAWRLDGPLGTLAQGDTAGAHNVTVTAPPTPVDWRLAAVATDGAGNTTTLAFLIRVVDDPLQVTLPDGGLAFPPLVPGATDLSIDGALRIDNLGDADVTPLLDVSDLHGPATIPVAGTLHVRVDDGPWTPYDGPLMPLPALGAGDGYDLAFRLAAVPEPLPAGSYGTSLTVTA